MWWGKCFCNALDGKKGPTMADRLSPPPKIAAPKPWLPLQLCTIPYFPLHHHFAKMFAGSPFPPHLFSFPSDSLELLRIGYGRDGVRRWTLQPQMVTATKFADSFPVPTTNSLSLFTKKHVFYRKTMFIKDEY